MTAAALEPLTVAGSEEFIAFAILRYGANRLASEELPTSRLGPIWILALRFFIPVGAATLLLWWLWISADWTASVTCLSQWAGAGILLLILNRRLARNLRR